MKYNQEPSGDEVEVANSISINAATAEVETKKQTPITPETQIEEPQTTVSLSDEDRQRAEEEEKKKAAAAAVQKSPETEEPAYAIAAGHALKDLKVAHEKYKDREINHEEFTKISTQFYQPVKCENSTETHLSVKDVDGQELKIPLKKDPHGATVPDLDPTKLQEVNTDRLTDPDYAIAVRRCGIDENAKQVKDVAIETFYEMEGGKLKCSNISLPENATIRDNNGQELPEFTTWKASHQDKGVQDFLRENHATVNWENLRISAQGKDGRMGDLCSAKELGNLMKDKHPEIAQSLEQGHGVVAGAKKQQTTEVENVIAVNGPRSAENMVVVQLSLHPENVEQITNTTKPVAAAAVGNLSPSQTVANSIAVKTKDTQLTK
jgi:hypothetical protein